MKTILIKTKKRRDNTNKKNLEKEIQEQLLNNKILLIDIDLENIELLISDEDLNFLINKILEF